MNRIEIDVITGEQKVVQLTAEEVAQAQIENQQWTAIQQELDLQKQAVTDAKQAALNKLMALGLTEEEALALGK